MNNLHDILGIVTLFATVGLGGWCKWLDNERQRFIEDIRESKRIQEQHNSKIEVIDQMLRSNYLTRLEHDKFEDRIVTAIDKLGQRVDRFLSHCIDCQKNLHEVFGGESKT